VIVTPQPTTGDAGFSGSSQEQPSAKRSIFRAEALKYYQENQQKVVMPPLVSPRVFLSLWLLAGLMALIGLVLAVFPWLDGLVVSLP
jgi:hypothetical protein